jgi:hypothetical protein
LHGKTDHLDLGKLGGYLPRRLEAVHPRHMYVREHRIRLYLVGKVRTK